jgi:hypothetical protein
MGPSLGSAGSRNIQTTLSPPMRHRRNRRATNSGDTNVDLARSCKANLLLVGAEQSVSTFVCALWPAFDEPLMMRRIGGPLRLPPSSEPVGTIIILGVETLSESEQRALQDWLVLRKGRTRVVSTSSAALMPMVEAGTFSDSLYYRLNVVYIDLNTGAEGANNAASSLAERGSR